ncbi:bifunctional diguanylate cyclase/phosphodiesterase [Rhizobium rhododendri]|uniref:EAL domain-containing protein n=1 Tax=Rhizobium rhododendri TaxID=2506430 RepID=A0ABY8INS0_9HYPH|nr:EAL domain-containing protein [Rhizobium rhododendri]WFS25101.1 EAL domain-containing protein [Rhizobium rhododendri]
MFRVLTCLSGEHDLRLVVLAGILCFLSSYVAMMLLQRAQKTGGIARGIWLATAGVAGGFGIWSTHFIAMLAYDPGVVVGYEAYRTFLSLLIAVATTGASVATATYLRSRAGFLAGGSLFALGVGAMHFLGMSAIEFPGKITWDRDLIAASLLLGCLFSMAGFSVAYQCGNSLRSKLLSASMLTLGVVSLHFTAMGGVNIVPAAVQLDRFNLLSPIVMIVTIASVSLSLLASGLAAALFAVRAENAASASNANFKMLIEGVTDYAIYMLGLQGHVSSWNAGAERASGYTAAEIVGKHFAIFYSQKDRHNGIPATALDIARTRDKFEGEYWYYRKDGTCFWAHVVINPIFADNGELAGYAKIIRDKTIHKADADRLAAVMRNLDVALQNMSQGICLFDANECLVLANERYSEIFGFPPGFIVPGLRYRDIVERGYSLTDASPDVYGPKASHHYDRNMAVVRGGEHGAIIHRLSSGTSVQANYNTMESGAWVVTFEDITARLLSEEKISFMASHDGLTGLANRAEFNASLAQELVLARRTAAQLAVIVIDLDKFKEINDQHGHATGDQVLSVLADRMTAMLDDDEFVARFGGDEFAAVKRFTEMVELHDFLARLEACLCAEIHVEGFEIKPGASMGIALYPQDADSAELLLGNADLAMYRAKGALRQSVCFYETAMDEAARGRRALANDLWAAVEKKQFHLHYQVQKSVMTGAVTGYEALLRWNHPDRGNVPPMDFIVLAEECGAILPIGEWVLREACREAARWQQPHKIAVNLSPVQLMNTDIAALVHTVLLDTGLNPARLELEITETSIITDKDRALHALRQIKQLGVSIAIDDFGTGYSSLETLRAFPFDKIKLDRSFMDQVETSPQAKAIVRAILALGQSLEVPVLAEGVETRVQLDILLSEGCNEAQGYFLGRPKPMHEDADADQTITPEMAA